MAPAPSSLDLLPILDFVVPEEKSLMRSDTVSLQPSTPDVPDLPTERKERPEEINTGRREGAAPMWTWSEAELRTPTPEVGAWSLKASSPNMFRQRVLKQPMSVSVICCHDRLCNILNLYNDPCSDFNLLFDYLIDVIVIRVFNRDI